MWRWMIEANWMTSSLVKSTLLDFTSCSSYCSRVLQLSHICSTISSSTFRSTNWTTLPIGRPIFCGSQQILASGEPAFAYSWINLSWVESEKWVWCWFVGLHLCLWSGGQSPPLWPPEWNKRPRVKATGPALEGHILAKPAALPKASWQTSCLTLPGQPKVYN